MATKVIAKVGDKRFKFGEMSDPAIKALVEQHKNMIQKIDSGYDVELQIGKQLSLLELFTNTWQFEGDKNVWDYLADNQKSENNEKFNIFLNGKSYNFLLPLEGYAGIIIIKNDTLVVEFIVELYIEALTVMYEGRFEELQESTEGIKIGDKTYGIDITNKQENMYTLIVVGRDGTPQFVLHEFEFGEVEELGKVCEEDSNSRESLMI